MIGLLVWTLRDCLNTKNSPLRPGEPWAQPYLIRFRVATRLPRPPDFPNSVAV
jgi:hypothetical protein